MTDWNALSDSLCTPTVQLFANDLWAEAITYEVKEWMTPLLANEWTQLGLVVLALVAGVGIYKTMLNRMGVASRFWKYALTVWFMGVSYIGATKVIQILSKSSADSGINLTSVEAGITNDYSFVTAVATGGDPTPMWYREVVSNDWTLATNDGWVVHSVDLNNGIYTREWRNSSTNTEVIAHRMWYFGQNPPAVEISAEGGVEILSAVFTGNFARFVWTIPDNINLHEGSTVVLQNSYFDERPIVWRDSQMSLPCDHSTNETTVTGFFLDRDMGWRFRLEVPL